MVKTLSFSTAGGADLIPGQGTKITSHMPHGATKKRKKRKKKSLLELYVK